MMYTIKQKGYGIIATAIDETLAKHIVDMLGGKRTGNYWYELTEQVERASHAIRN